MVHQTTRTQDEAIELAVLVQFLDTVEQTGDNVVSAGSLATRQDNADVDSREVYGFATFFKLNQRHTVGVREQIFDSFLVGNRLSRFAFLYFHSA